MLPGVTLSENMADYNCIHTSTGIDSWYFLSSSWVFKEGSSRKEGQFIISKECFSLLSKYVISGSHTFSVMPPFRGQKIIILKPSVWDPLVYTLLLPINHSVTSGKHSKLAYSSPQQSFHIMNSSGFSLLSAGLQRYRESTQFWQEGSCY